MDTLFNKLQQEIAHFIALAKLANTKISSSGLKSQKIGRLDGYINFWNKVISDTTQDQTKLTQALTLGIYKNKQGIDDSLEAFRQLPRYVSECSPTWSAYYDDIDKSLTELCKTRREIDRKYKLGQHKDD